MSLHRVRSSQSFARRAGILGLLALAASLPAPAPLRAQQVVSRAEQVITVSRGASALLVNPVNIARITLGDPGIAEANVVSPTEVVINGKALGTTTLLLWDRNNQVRIYSVEVTADAAGLQRYLRSMMPDELIDVSASGNTVTLSGTVKDPNSVARAVEVAKTSGATIFDNILAPPAEQVLLKVRFAEVNRTVLREWASALAAVNPHELSDNGDWAGSTTSDGVIRFLLENDPADCAALQGPGSCISALIRASKAKGDFRSLAEPNLVTLPGEEAYFLAGGEFPFPTIQASQNNNAVTIVFKDFGIKLRYTAEILRSGAIRLKLAPEVSALDFANGLVINGFEVPTILSRRAETQVELRPGQHLVIAGLLDNNSLRNVTKIPLLGDIPIIGELFKSREVRQGKRELLVLVSPEIVRASNTAPSVPTGEPSTWGLDGSLTKPAVPQSRPRQAPAQQAPAPAAPAPQAAP